MERSEKRTCSKLIEPALIKAGWNFNSRVRLGSGTIIENGSESPASTIFVDYLLIFRGITLAALEMKSEFRSAAEGMQQASRYARLLFLRFSVSTNGHDWILMDNSTGEFEALSFPPSPQDLIKRSGWSIDWHNWDKVFSSAYFNGVPLHLHQVMAINHVLIHFASGNRRAQISMAAGSGKSLATLQLVWKYLEENNARRRVLFLTDHKALNEQMYELFGTFPEDERHLIDKEIFARASLKEGKLFFTTVQRMNTAADGMSLYEHFDNDFFDLIVLNDVSDNFPEYTLRILNYFVSALQLRVSNELDFVVQGSVAQSFSSRTSNYFGAPVFIYTSMQATDDGYLVPHRIFLRPSDIRGKGYSGSEQNQSFVQDSSHNIRTHSQTREIAEDLWNMLDKNGSRDEKTVVFCSDITHAGLMVTELQRLSGSQSYAVSFTTNQRNVGQIQKDFSRVGTAHPRIIVTVDLFVGLDVPDIQNLVFVRRIQNLQQYRKMKSVGSRRCPQIGKKHFSIFDYSGASLLEEHHPDSDPVDLLRGSRTDNNFLVRDELLSSKDDLWKASPSVFIDSKGAHFADGRVFPVNEYLEQARTVIRKVCHDDLNELYRLWVSKKTRQILRNDLQSQYISVPVLSRYLQLPDTDEVDILANIGFQLSPIPTRAERVERLWEEGNEWLPVSLTGLKNAHRRDLITRLWQAALDHYSHSSIDKLEQAETYDSPLFVELFGGFVEIVRLYGNAREFRRDLEQIKQQLYTSIHL